MRLVYHCEFCDDQNADIKKAEKHENQCDSNPVSKGCRTCTKFVHGQNEGGDDATIYYSCEEDLFEKSHKVGLLDRHRMKRNCESHIAKNGCRHDIRYTINHQ